jgi:uncharacterized protein YodC (DUF2158 family)
MDIKDGDVVMLKSGGPKMTVVYVGNSRTEHSGNISCKWFRGDEKFEELQYGSFSDESLVVVNDKTGS